jgi:hypothetical protein
MFSANLPSIFLHYQALAGWLGPGLPCIPWPRSPRRVAPPLVSGPGPPSLPGGFGANSFQHVSTLWTHSRDNLALEHRGSRLAVTARFWSAGRNCLRTIQFGSGWPSCIAGSLFERPETKKPPGDQARTALPSLRRLAQLNAIAEGFGD